MIQHLEQSKPGRRFVDYYHHHGRNGSKPTWKSWLLMSLGFVLLIAGLVLSLPPGIPGFLLWIPGLALIASQLKIVAITLDRLEYTIRKLYQKITGRSL